MIKVECDDCKAPYQVDERRIPASGLKMRCPRCGKSFVVRKPDAAAGLELDLPAKAPEPAPKPAEAATAARARSFELDLPAPGGAVLPASKAKTGGFGASLRAAAGLPAAKSATSPQAPNAPNAKSAAESRADLELDLPDGLGGAGLPALGAVGAELPSPAAPSEIDLPSAPSKGAMSGFGELPLLADEGSQLPTPLGELPTVTSPGVGQLPSSAADTQLPPVAFGSVGPLDHIEIDVPSASAHAPIELGGDLEFEPGFASASASGASLSETGIEPNFSPLPPRDVQGTQGARGHEIELDEFEPPPRAGRPPAEREPTQADDWLRLGSLPAPPATPSIDKPRPSPPAKPNEAPVSFDSPLELDDLVPSGGHAAQKAAPAAPREPMASDAGEIGQELELVPVAGAPMNLGAGIASPTASSSSDSSTAARDKRHEVVSENTEARIVRGRKRSRVAAAVIAALVLGGSALALAPDVGPFGYYAIRDRVRAGADSAELEALRRRAQGELAGDTFAGARAAQELARGAAAGMPRYEPMTAYAAFVTYASELRFGRRPEDEAAAGVLITKLAGEDGDDARLARAAQKAVAGEFAPARDAAAQIAERRAADLDVLLLVAEIDLALKANERALASFQRALAATPGKEAPEAARCLFGVARARLALGDAKGAEAAARDTIKLSPRHAGARTLIASIAWREPAREAEAQKLLEEVTGDTQTTKGASDRELVAALSVLGRLHLAKSRLTAADQAFVKALKLDPRAIDALVGQGELHFLAGRYSEAASRFDTAMNADADSVAAKIGAVKTHLALERVPKARELVKKLREARPKDATVLYWAGRAEQAGGNRKDAEAAYEAAIVAAGTSPEATLSYVALANLLSSQGRADDAQKKLAEAEQKFGDAPALLRAKGELELGAGRYESARKHFEAVLAKEDDLGTRFKLGTAQRLSRAFDEATVTFDKIASADKDYPGLALERGLLAEQMGNPDRALEMYADALRKAPNDVDLKLRIGSTQVTGGHPDQAEPILREVIKTRPNSAEANHFLGRALLVRGSNLAEAMRFLERAAELDPNKAEYHLFVGWGANDSGQPAKAEASLKKALELDRELGDAYWQRGVLLQKQGATRDALADLKLALEKRPSRHEAYATMAICHQDQSQWQQAEEAWRKAIEANGAVPEWRYRLGKLYAQRANRAGSQAELEQATKLLETQARGNPGWAHDAYFLLAEALKASDRERAVRAYRKFLELAPRDHAYRGEAEKAVEALGGKR